ncbi:DC-STAMP domain-containing protein 2 [Trichonephila clavipes]|nr:DC-STAMP domain-containing protein 2 [Trichonephila clavipes]
MITIDDSSDCGFGNGYLGQTSRDSSVSRGRTVLMAYTYILVMSGPFKNALRNANVLVNSLNCGQEIVIKQTKAMLKAIFAPLIAIVDIMRDILKALKEFARMMKEAFIAIRDLFLEIKYPRFSTKGHLGNIKADDRTVKQRICFFVISYTVTTRSSADLSSFWAPGAEDLQVPLALEDRNKNQKIWLSPAYPGPGRPPQVPSG